MGKRTLVDAYRMQQRGGKGVINIKTGLQAGQVVAIKSVVEDDELMIITRNGVVNRQQRFGDQDHREGHPGSSPGESGQKGHGHGCGPGHRRGRRRDGRGG